MPQRHEVTLSEWNDVVLINTPMGQFKVVLCGDDSPGVTAMDLVVQGPAGMLILDVDDHTKPDDRGRCDATFYAGEQYVAPTTRA